MIDLFVPIERRSTLSNPARWLVDFFSGEPTKSGMRVNAETALAVSAVYACVQVRAKNLAAMPVKLFRRLPDGGKEPATRHPLYSLFASSPHPDLTRFEFMEMMQGHKDLRGNCYAQIVRDGAGRVVRLVPLHPDRVSVERGDTTPDGLRPLTYVVNNSGLGGTQKLSAFDVLHIRDFSGDGVIGHSRVRVAAESIGLALAADTHAARMFSNGARPVGVLEHPNRLDDPGRDNLRNSWQAVHGGVENAGKVAILEEGMKYHQIGLSNEDMQLLDSRRFSRSEIASIFMVPPDRIGADSSSGTYANVEQRQLQFVQDCMGTEAVCWEQRLDLALLSDTERREYFFKFNLAALIRGSLLDRYNAYRIAVGRAGEPGWITVNDIRETEDMNRVKDGDKLFTGIQPPAGDKLARALRPLLTDALGRAFRKEARAVRAIGKKPAAEQPAELESFYRDHRRYLIETVSPVFAAARDMEHALEGTEDALADALISDSRATIAAGADHEKMLTTWETTRAATVAEKLIS